MCQEILVLYLHLEPHKNSSNLPMVQYKFHLNLLAGFESFDTVFNRVWHLIINNGKFHRKIQKTKKQTNIQMPQKSLFVKGLAKIINFFSLNN